MSVIVIGSVNVDIVTYADRAPRPGESLTGHRYSMVLGGKGANQSVAVARLGTPVRFIGRIGADSFGEFIRSQLAGLGVDPGCPRLTSSAPEFMWATRPMRRCTSAISLTVCSMVLRSIGESSSRSMMSSGR